jgi:GNAT superfamily N-acetyltransferase
MTTVGPAWTIREVCTGDAPAIAAHRYHHAEPQSDLDAYAAWLGPRIERGAYVGFVAVQDGRTIAGAGAVLLDWGPTRGEPHGTRARLVNVFTEATHRRQGLAGALLARVMDACDAQGVRVFNLAASSDGAPIYRALGFVPYENEMILRRA